MRRERENGADRQRSGKDRFQHIVAANEAFANRRGWDAGVNLEALSRITIAAQQP
ncbi:hypothetical protein [Bradyrhizobium acaciae]|uniref:hypothetical protein n=1 Tax=Bradyrhizobium acaciae TaxID=2683706 RepID=UPI001E5CDDF6|nr:hypothetical protein [Bradyrhizobium acaciae]MCC8980048.1 hypothetical protein [Bradyrhizobium acaciae]